MRAVIIYFLKTKKNKIKIISTYSLYDEATTQDWKSILELAQRWFFQEMKSLAIRELQNKSLSPVERIELYHRNAVDRRLLADDYLALCQRPDPLNYEEGLELGLETTLMIARTREDIRSPRSPAGVVVPLTPTLQGQELVGQIQRVFVGGSDAIVVAEPVPKPSVVVTGVNENGVNDVGPWFVRID